MSYKKEIVSAEYIVSAPSIRECPQTNIPEYAFIGRSNVGKSSLINMLTGRKNLARTSSTPGKTQTINYFLINREWHIVDLPGYGWAKTGREKKKQWSKNVQQYLLERNALTLLFILLDIRLVPQDIDIELINWAGENGIPLAIVFTKVDKLSKNKVTGSVDRYKKTLFQFWDELPPVFLSSAKNRTGKEDILNYIHQVNESLSR